MKNYLPFLTILWAAACVDSPELASVERTESSTSALSVKADVHAALHARIDRSRSKIIRGVAASDVANDALPSRVAFRDALLAETGLALTSEEVRGNGILAKAGPQTLELDMGRRAVNLHDERGYSGAKSASLSDAALEGRAAALLNALGIGRTEMGKPEIVAFASDGRPLGAASVERRRLGQKAFFFRRIGGLKVAGHRMVVSYAVDGSVRAMRGQWPRIDIARSVLATALSEEEIINRAVDSLASAAIDASGKSPIRIETFFDVDDSGTESVLKLRGAALYQADGPDGPGRGVRHEFDM